MKKFMLNLAVVSLTALAVTACTTPASSNSANPGAGTPSSGSSASPGTGSGVSSGASFSTRKDFLTFAECVKVKSPKDASRMQGFINEVNAMTDAEWGPDHQASFKVIAMPYGNLGCN